MLKKKWLKLFLLALAVLILVAIISAITIYKMVSYIPKEYHPVPVDLAEQERINHYADKKMEELYNGLQMLDPFTIRIEQKSVNELLTLSQQQHWFGENEHLKQLQQPQISFVDGRLNLMARIQRENRSAVLTISIKPEITENGKLHILLDQIKIGAFPIPDTFLNHYKQIVLTRLNAFPQTNAEGKASQGTRERVANDWFIDTLENLQPTLTEFIRTNKIVTDAKLKDDKGWVQITDLTIKNQQLQIKLVPQPN